MLVLLTMSQVITTFNTAVFHLCADSSCVQLSWYFMIIVYTPYPSCVVLFLAIFTVSWSHLIIRHSFHHWCLHLDERNLYLHAQADPEVRAPAPTHPERPRTSDFYPLNYMAKHAKMTYTSTFNTFNDFLAYSTDTQGHFSSGKKIGWTRNPSVCVCGGVSLKFPVHSTDTRDIIPVGRKLVELAILRCVCGVGGSLKFPVYSTDTRDIIPAGRRLVELAILRVAFQCFTTRPHWWKETSDK